MKIFKSIKWRLQLWYGLILVAVLAGFGFTAYQLERQQLFNRVDDELHRRVGVLSDALRRPPLRGPGGAEQPFGGPPPGQLPAQGPPILPGDRPVPEFRLPPEAAGLFDTNNPNSFYFAITSLRGGRARAIARSANIPNPPINISITAESVGSADVSKQFPARFTAPPARQVGSYREIDNLLPSGELIDVGCSIAPELKELHRTAHNLTGVGGLILLIGVAGGWWFVSRALRPVENISAAAVKISAGDLSQRINVAETESELGKLAAVLNSTFARLDAAFTQQKQFASDAAHELRTPISVILTQTQTALNREREAAEYRETLEACQRAAQRMRKLIGALLELARIDAGQEQMKRLRFDFSGTVADCIELVRPLAKERGVKVFAELSPLEITGDPERLAQVVTNLLTNAIQYNKSNGEARVTLASQGGLAIFTVSDTGNGISRGDLPRVFQRFYRGDKSRTGDNAGLGLAISKAVVEAHGGAIEAASEEGAWTTFTVRLPIC